MSQPFVGSYSNESYNQAKRYRLKFQKGVPLADSEIFEVQSVNDGFLRQLVANNFPRGSSTNDGFKVIESAFSSLNNFVIKGGDGTSENAGLLFVDGYILFLKSDIEYVNQNDTGALTDDDYTKTNISATYPLTPPGVGTRTDTVYIDFYFAEVSALGTSEYTDASLIVSGIGTTTANRIRQVQDIRVEQGSVSAPADFTDANGIFHRCIKIAEIERTTSPNIITSMITDSRTLINSVKSYSQGTTITDLIMSDGQAIGDSTHRVSSIFMASIIDYSNDLILNSTTEKIRFTTTGNVGIGTSSPSQMLEVFSTTTNNGIKVRSTLTDSSPNIQIQNDVRTFLMKVDGSNSDSFTIRDITGGGDRLVINNSGNIGIGTANPTAKLHVNGSATIEDNLIVNGTTTTVNTEVTATDMFTINQDDNQYALSVNQITAGNNASVINVTNAGIGPIATFVGIGTGTSNVGIGTNNPSSKLDIVGSDINNYLRLKSTNAFEVRAFLEDSVGGALKFTKTENVNFGANIATTDASPLRFGTSDTERIRINADGRIQIGNNFISNDGTANKGLTIDSDNRISLRNTVYIDGQSRESLFLFDDTAMAMGVGGGISFQGKYTSVGDIANFASIKGIKANGTDSNYSGELHFQTRVHGSAPATRMMINEVGNVGIGTISSISRLSIYGTSVSLPAINVENNLTPTSFQWAAGATEATNIFSGRGTSDNWASIMLANNSPEATGKFLGGVCFGQPVSGKSSSDNVGIKATMISYTSGSGGSFAGFGGTLLFSTRADNGTINERMRILSNGFVGVGITNPGAQLESNSASSDPALHVYRKSSNSADTIANFFSDFGSVKNSVFRVSAGGVLTSSGLISTGNIGINITPTENLHVYSTGAYAKIYVQSNGLPGSSNKASQIAFGDSEGPKWTAGEYADSAGSFIIRRESSNQSGSIGNAIVISPDKHVTIENNLTVNGTTTTINTATTSTDQMSISQSDNDYALSVTQTNASTALAMQIITTGLGPSLVITANRSDNGMLRLRNSNANSESSIGFYDSTTTTRWIMGAGLYGYSPSNFIISDSSTARLTINSSGYVGLGITNPSTHLHIFDGATNASLRLQGSGGAKGIFDINSTDYSGSRTLTFTDGTTALMSIRGNGNVGIGTLDPQEKLHVQGSINTSSDIYLIGSGTRTVYFGATTNAYVKSYNAKITVYATSAGGLPNITDGASLSLDTGSSGDATFRSATSGTTLIQGSILNLVGPTTNLNANVSTFITSPQTRIISDSFELISSTTSRAKMKFLEDGFLWTDNVSGRINICHSISVLNSPDTLKGGYISVYGNNNAGNSGDITLVAGSTGDVEINGTEIVFGSNKLILDGSSTYSYLKTDNVNKIAFLCIEETGSFPSNTGAYLGVCGNGSAFPGNAYLNSGSLGSIWTYSPNNIFFNADNGVVINGGTSYANNRCTIRTDSASDNILLLFMDGDGSNFLQCKFSGVMQARITSSGDINAASFNVMAPADFAEWSKVEGNLSLYKVGTIVQQSETNDCTVELASSLSESIYGIITDRATFCGGLNNESKDDFMNLKVEELETKYNAKRIAMTGHVQCKVVGTIRRGQKLTMSNITGVAKAAITQEEKMNSFAIARQSYDSTEIGLIEVRL
jgi:hypothetical protein